MTILPPVGLRKVSLYLYSLHVLVFLLVIDKISGEQFVYAFGASLAIISGTLVAEHFSPTFDPKSSGP